ncbi:MAG: transposase [Clostridia bacterium]|nr:transposase [Clostridia bacterium]MEE1074864.1 transposase [Acutalibacteraceae bacterium]
MNLPKRKPTRLKNFDYSQNGYYFITVCTHNKRKILCDIVGEGLCALPTVKLTQIGEIVNEAVNYINSNYDGILVDKYVIMPNHIHLIISVQTGGHGDPPLQIYDVIGNFKSFTTYKYGQALWQRSFHDHVIREENDYLKIWNYIDTNPQKWREDCFYIAES